MNTISRGFTGRRRDEVKLPPGQYLEHGFPVLQAGPTPPARTETWTITTEAGDTHRWDWKQFTALPPADITVDIHEDGYSAQRSYSIASGPSAGRLELTVQRLEDGEVSPYLAGIAEPGDQFDLRGPIGGWFIWSPPPASSGPASPASPAGAARPLQLLAGGSGIVPLMSMIRAHGAANSEVPIGLIYSVCSPSDVIYASELSERTLSSPLSQTLLYTRSAHRERSPGLDRRRAPPPPAPPPPAPAHNPPTDNSKKLPPPWTLGKMMDRCVHPDVHNDPSSFAKRYGKSRSR